MLLLSTADWDATLWTNKQYMARELASTNDVVYVESLGLRRPRLDAADLGRMGRRLVGGRRPAPPVPPGVEVVRPLVVPLHAGWTRALNERLVRRVASRWRSRPGPPVLWTYSPLTYGLERCTSRRVYHAVDLLGEYPGVAAAEVAAGERRLAALGTTAIASSPPVRDHLERQGFERILDWPNVGEVAPFAARAGGVDRVPNRVVFGGNVTGHKLDAGLVAALALARPELDIVLAGPVEECGRQASADVDELRRLGVRFTGPLTVDALADLYAGASVGIIPYRDTSYTRGVSPLKLFEYLAAGLAVVSTDLPALVARRDELDPADVVIASDARSFVAAVARLAVRPSDDALRRRARLAAANSWERRGEQARRLVRAVAACAEHGAEHGAEPVR